MTHSKAGARARVRDPEAVLRQASGWASAHAADVLLADARLVFGEDHLESAALHAERARRAGTMAARSLSLETLLYLTGERQVSGAIRRAGLKPGTDRIAIVVFGDVSADEVIAHLGWTREDRVLEASGKAISVLGVSRTALDTVPRNRAADLALERVALVDVEK